MEKSNKEQVLNLSVADDLTVTVYPNSNHEFLMPSKQVAIGFGVGIDTIRRHKKDHLDELFEGKHFISGVSIPHAASPGSSKGTLWTKRGIIRLGFFIKSHQARMFRDWAEDLVIEKVQKSVQVNEHRRSLPKPRRHNRLTPERLLAIMADVARVEDYDLRLSLTNKLMQ